MSHEGMVHALEEAWRVLRPRGRLVDIRPLAVPAPLHVCVETDEIQVGCINQRKGEPDDRACEAALERVQRRGLFTGGGTDRFSLFLYWESAPAMARDVAENWVRRGEPLAPEVVERAAFLLQHHGPEARLRGTLEMRLAWHEKRLDPLA